MHEKKESMREQGEKKEKKKEEREEEKKGNKKIKGIKKKKKKLERKQIGDRSIVQAAAIAGSGAGPAVVIGALPKHFTMSFW